MGMEPVDERGETGMSAFHDRLPAGVHEFVTAAMPYSNWGQTYFEIRLMELSMADSMFGNLFRPGGKRALDIGCGLGLASVYLAEFFDQVDGTDIEELGVAFKIDRPAPVVGAELLAKLGRSSVHLHCGDTLQFLSARPGTYDFVMSHFVLEHVPQIEPLCEAIAASLRPGGRTFHIVPNTHDTIIQLLRHNLQPLWRNIRQAWRLRRQPGRAEGRLVGNLFTPITHSEFLDDYSAQFEVNASEHYLFPLIKSGLRILDIKPMREHAYGILAVKE